MPTVLSKLVKTPRGRDALYSGDVDENGQAHGYGERIVTSKDEYEGQIQTGVFEHGVHQGTGSLLLPDSYHATGQFANGDPDGVARIDHTDGTNYAGQFKGGKRHGFGTITFSDGRVIIGWFADGDFHGIALRVKADGSKEAVTYEHNKIVSRTSGLADAYIS
jgi:hypothetical protein